jgi:hypothetical protein
MRAFADWLELVEVIDQARSHPPGGIAGGKRGVTMSNPGFMGQQAAQQAAASASRAARNLWVPDIVAQGLIWGFAVPGGLVSTGWLFRVHRPAARLGTPGAAYPHGPSEGDRNPGAPAQAA